jgi:hypothetical protein
VLGDAPMEGLMGDFIKEHPEACILIRWPTPKACTHDLGVGHNVFPKLWCEEIWEANDDGNCLSFLSRGVNVHMY